MNLLPITPGSAEFCEVNERETDLKADEFSLVRAAQHDPAALAALYQEHYTPIARYVRGRVWDEHEAEDIIADVFLTMLRKLPGYRVRGIPFRIWLYRIATIQLRRSARRRQRRALREVGEAEVNEAANEAGEGSDVEMIHLVIATLPDRLQTVLALHYLEGLRVADIAKVTRCPEGTIKSRLSEARALMRKRLEKRGFTNE